MARSHGQRSSSLSGLPLRIFSTLARGCRSSPSRKATPRAPASMAATVVLPEPETPITMAMVFIAGHPIDELSRPPFRSCQLEALMNPGSVPDARTGLVVTPAHKAFFKEMPKVELHCHLLGAVRRETFIHLAERGNAPIEREEIEAFYTRGEKPVGVLRVLRALDEHLLTRPDDLHRIAYEYLQDVTNHNVRHAEFFWNPTGTVRVSKIAYPDAQDAIVRAIRDARRDFGISALLIPSIDTSC